jgi:uncharacterized membrane protein
MKDILYIIAIVLIIGWLIGFFVFNAGSVIHLLLIIAVIAIIVRVIQGKRIIN